MMTVLIAVDPGREKCGIAVVNRQEGALFKKVVATNELTTVIAGLAAKYDTVTILVGNGTSHLNAVKGLSGVVVNGERLIIELVDERHTTELARVRYWRENPPRGLRRLIPVTMQIPPVPVDAYVAVILAERYFENESEL